MSSDLTPVFYCKKCFRKLGVDEGTVVLSCQCFVCVACDGIRIKTNRCPGCSKEGVQAQTLHSKNGDNLQEIQEICNDTGELLENLHSAMSFQTSHLKATIARLYNTCMTTERDRAQLQIQVQSLRAELEDLKRGYSGGGGISPRSPQVMLPGRPSTATTISPPSSYSNAFPLPGTTSSINSRSQTPASTPQFPPTSSFSSSSLSSTTASSSVMGTPPPKTPQERGGGSFPSLPRHQQLQEQGLPQRPSTSFVDGHYPHHSSTMTGLGTHVQRSHLSVQQILNGESPIFQQQQQQQQLQQQQQDQQQQQQPSQRQQRLSMSHSPSFPPRPQPLQPPGTGTSIGRSHRPGSGIRPTTTGNLASRLRSPYSTPNIIGSKVQRPFGGGK